MTAGGPGVRSGQAPSPGAAGVLGAGVVLVLGLAATVIGLWPGLVSAELTGGGQAALFFAGLGMLVWGGTWLGTGAGSAAGRR